MLSAIRSIGQTAPDLPSLPETCPTCGRAYEPFQLDKSGILDWIEVLKTDLLHLQRYIEEVLP
jgi:hypothetical protein